MGSFLAGRKYDRCKNKTVEIDNYYKEVGARGNSWNPTKPDGPYDLKFSAALKCPRTRAHEINISSHVWTGKMDAVANLRKIASELACKSCPFSRMNPQEVEEYNARELEARAVRIRAQNAVDFAKKQSAYIESLGMEEMKELNARVDTPTIADLPVGAKETSQ